MPLPSKRGNFIEETKLNPHLPLDLCEQLGLGEEETQAGDWNFPATH